MSALLGGWAISLEAAVRAEGAAYDDPTANYDAGDMYDADGLPQWAVLDCQLLSVSAGRGARPSPSPGSVAEAGSLTADLYDPGRLYDPVSGTMPALVEPGAPVRLVARRGPDTMVVWTGTADAWEHDLLSGEGRLTATDQVARLAATEVVALDRPAERTPDRLAALLAVMPDPPPSSLTGVGRDLCAATLSGDVWQCMAAVVDTDQSWLWLDPAGTLTWQGRGIPAAPQPIFADCPDDSPGWAGIYTSLPTAVDASQLVNVVTAQRVQPPGATADPFLYVNDASRLRWDPHSHENTALQLASDAEVDQWAADLLELRSYPAPRPDRMVLTVADALPWADGTMAALLGLDLGSPVRVRLTSRGPVQEWVCVVSSLEHRADPGEWTTTVGLALWETVGIGGYDAQSSRFDRSGYDEAVPVRRMEAAA